MTDRELMQMALDALEAQFYTDGRTIKALRDRLAQPEPECIYPECETGIGCDGPCGEQPVDTVKQEPVAWRWKERINDEFDSDWILTTYNPPPYAIQQEPLYAQPVDTVNISQERVDETAKCKHEPVAWMNPRNNAVIDARKKKQIGEGDGYPRFSVPLYAQPVDEIAKRGHDPVAWITRRTGDGGAYVDGYETCEPTDYGAFPVYTAPPKREWQGLTSDNKHFLLANAWNKEQAFDDFMEAIDKFLEEKNT